MHCCHEYGLVTQLTWPPSGVSTTTGPSSPTKDKQSAKTFFLFFFPRSLMFRFFCQCFVHVSQQKSKANNQIFFWPQPELSFAIVWMVFSADNGITPPSDKWSITYSQHWRYRGHGTPAAKLESTQEICPPDEHVLNQLRKNETRTRVNLWVGGASNFQFLLRVLFLCCCVLQATGDWWCDSVYSIQITWKELRLVQVHVFLPHPWLVCFPTSLKQSRFWFSKFSNKKRKKHQWPLKALSLDNPPERLEASFKTKSGANKCELLWLVRQQTHSWAA